MKLTKKCVAATAAAALTLTALPAVPASQVQAADSVDQTVRLQPWDASTFNDTNGDGLGEFEGWGTSLCWWANRIGYSEELTTEAAEAFFSDDGLDMNIGRYNVGGGDATGEVQDVQVNENAVFYDLFEWGTNPTGAGSSMKVETYSKMENITYSSSDADFGFTKGDKVGSFQKIGWINKLDDAVGSGDNLRYTVNVAEAGTYTVKLLLTLEGTNTRDVAIRVNEGDGQTDYVADTDTVNNSIIASGNSSGSNCMLFSVAISDVELQAGDNTINIAGKKDWTLDFVKMAIIKSGEEGVLPAEDEFTHAEHIIRSDSGVPGYATDVTKIDLDQHELSWYQENFARADEECGYAWNYDWNADKNQMNVLKAAAAASGEDFIAEAFSNSPPYFMTVSGCSSGNVDSNTDNLREDSVNAFAAYMADVIEHWNNEGVITFQSTTPMNEPYTNYWGAYSNKQEGCHFDQGESQSRIIEALNAELENKGIDIIISGTDETSIDTQITSYNKLSDEAKEIVDRIDTHTYSGSDRAGLKSLAENEGKNLWMSEVDGAYTAGTNAGEMSAALGLAQRMMTDVNGLGSSAWILWNAIDMHADSSEYGQSWVDKGSANDYLSMDALEAAWQSRSSNGYWGLAAADHDNGELVLSMKYYAYGQFSRYIRPGYTIIGSSRGSVLSAYDPEGQKAVIVAMNTSGEDKTWKFDLSGFETMGDSITAIRTSGSMDDGEKWADVTASDNIAADTENNAFTATMKANSITTYIVEGVSGIKEDAGEDSIAVKQIPVTADQVTGSEPWNGDQTNGVANVIDNNYSTFFDGVLDGYVIIDLGEQKEIAAVSYAPRSGFADRCVGATIYGSNNGTDWTPLYTIDAAPAQNTDTFVYYTDFNTTECTYQYIKYAQTPSGNCNLSELKIYELAPVVESELTAHYDMSHEGNLLKDISGKGNDATLYDTEDSDFAVYGDEEVLQFNNRQYATIPSGVIDDAAAFTIQAVVNAPETADNWVWCIGDGIGQWGAGNISDYIFMSANSGQGEYGGSVLAAVKVGSESSGGESRMPVPSAKLDSGYTAVTLVSDGNTMTLYMNGEKVSELSHDKDLTNMIPDGDILGYIGQSLYSPDRKLIGNVSDIRIWDTALDADTVKSLAPTAEEKTDMLLADIQSAMLNGNASLDAVESDLSFPAAVDGIDLTWEVPENEAVTQDGKVTLPAEDVNLTIKVTYTCYGAENTVEFPVTVLGENIDKILDAAKEALDIPNKDDVRGNITLPESTESGVAIKWETDHPEIVDVVSHEVDGYDAMPAGVVTRPQADTEVKMTATLTYKENTRTKEFTLNIKAAPEEIEEDDYTDYFFAYFAGEGYSDGEQIYFASSQDGLDWDDLNNNNPILTSTLGEEGVRDPFIIRSPEGDKFYLIATDLKIYGNGDWTAAQNSGSQSLMVWESTDLVNWSDQRMVEVSAEIEAGCTWAPEATYDPKTGEYVVYWASRTPKVDEKQRLYYAKTRDFYTFTEPQLYIEKDQSSIDTTMIEYNGTYYRYTKNEGSSTNEVGALTKTIFIEKSDSVLGNFTSIESDSLNSNQWVEGPTIFKLNNDDVEQDTWCLLVDDFGGRGYYPLLTTDLESGEFTSPASDTYQMPSRARHGTPIRITSEEYAAIMAAYGSPEEVNTTTVMGETPDLPDTVKVGETSQNVTWNLDGVSFTGNPYSYVTVTGTVENSIVEATANVQLIPSNLEYMIDCNNLVSETWKRLSDTLLNSEAADQAKTDENSWGYVSTVGEDGADMTDYSMTSATNPYAGGYWARSGKNISYQVTLPAGEHQIMLGCTGWWSMGRQMDVYYSVNSGVETKLCDLDAVSNQEIYNSGTITLEDEAVVTLTVKTADGNDPILSWISVSGIRNEPEVDTTGLQAAIDSTAGLAAADYTESSYSAVETALAAANALITNPTSQEEVDAARETLENAVAALVSVKDLKAYYELHKDYTADSYTEESFAAYTAALNSAKAVLEDADASQSEVDDALAALTSAVEGLEQKQEAAVSKDALQTLYDTWKDVKQGNYTDQSFNALQEALKKAADVLGDQDASQQTVDEAYSLLEKAVKELVETEEPGSSEVNKDNLQNLYDTNKNIPQGNYTDASYQAYLTALEAARNILNDPNADQDAVSKAYNDLLDAVRGLTAGSVSQAGGSESKDQADVSAETGDNTPIAGVIAVMILALASFAAVLYMRRKRS